MRAFISKDQRWHIWQGAKHILLSDEDNKHLTYHSTPDAVVNYLYLAGHKEVARELNEHVKPPKPCKPCDGTGVHRPSQVLGWGVSTPEMKCRHCLGTGKERTAK